MRIVLVDDADYPGSCRVIWKRHVAEMTDLEEDERRHLMGAVFAVESALRQTLHPDKINLASLGNVVPHLHWHVIPRRRDDRHFPRSIWSAPLRDAASLPSGNLSEMLKAALTAQLASTA